ncbi:MAG: DUF2628 domain-containing protein [Clostridia bacterium]|nr:DUF2628 domain-containing protein [Clostridia bacterium]
MRYENEKCSFCGEPFKEDDKIVVCPECGAPHHKSCYEQISKCAFEDLHKEGYVWTGVAENFREEPVAEEKIRQTKVCPVCQAENDGDAENCANCGAPFLVTREQTDQQKVNIDGEYVSTGEFIDPENTVTVGEAAVYIKANSEKFIKSFLRAKFGKTRQNFNFAALFFSPFWFFYRKMYLPGLLFSGAHIAAVLFFMSLVQRCFPEAIAYISDAAASGMKDMTAIFEKYQQYVLSGAQQHPALYKVLLAFPLIFIIINVVAGFTANRFYLSKIKKDVLKIKSISPNKDTLYAYLYAKGGTSILMVIAAIFLLDSLTQTLLML